MVRDNIIHDDKPRPVSGEIMSAAVIHEDAVWLRNAENICDAQFETLPQSPKTAWVPEAGITAIAASPARGMEFLTKGTLTTRRGARGGPLFWSAGLISVALAFWISGGHMLMAYMASPVSTRMPLQIAGVASHIEARGDRKVLFIQGRAENHGNQTLELPAIDIAVTGNDGAVTRYHLASRETRLEPGHRHAFTSRLQAPDGGVKSVSVAFAEEGR